MRIIVLRSLLFIGEDGNGIDPALNQVFVMPVTRALVYDRTAVRTSRRLLPHLVKPYPTERAGKLGAPSVSGQRWILLSTTNSMYVVPVKHHSIVSPATSLLRIVNLVRYHSGSSVILRVTEGGVIHPPRAARYREGGPGRKRAAARAPEGCTAPTICFHSRHGARVPGPARFGSRGAAVALARPPRRPLRPSMSVSPARLEGLHVACTPAERHPGRHRPQQARAGRRRHSRAPRESVPSAVSPPLRGRLRPR